MKVEVCQSSCLFCTVACTIKFKVESNGKLTKIKNSGNVLSSNEKSLLIKQEPEAPTIDFVICTMLNIPIEVWNSHLSNHGVTIEALTVALCDSCEMNVDRCFSWHCEITKMLDARRKLIKDKIFQSRCFLTVDCGQSSFWNSVRQESILDSLREKNTNKSAQSAGAQNSTDDDREMLTVLSTLLGPPLSGDDTWLVDGPKPIKCDPDKNPDGAYLPNNQSDIGDDNSVVKRNKNSFAVTRKPDILTNSVTKVFVESNPNVENIIPNSLEAVTYPDVNVKHPVTPPNGKPTIAVVIANPIPSVVNVTPLVAPTPPALTLPPSMLTPPAATKLTSMMPLVENASSAMEDEIVILPASSMPIPTTMITISEDETNSTFSPPRKKAKQTTKSNKNGLNNYNEKSASLITDKRERGSIRPQSAAALSNNSLGTNRTMDPAEILKCQGQPLYKGVALAPTLIQTSVTPTLTPVPSVPQPCLANCCACLVCANKATPPKHSVWATLLPTEYQLIQSPVTMGSFAIRPFEVRQLVLSDVEFFKPSVAQWFYGKNVYKCTLCPRFFASDMELIMGIHSQLHWNGDGVCCKLCGWLLNKYEVVEHGQLFHGMIF